MSTTATSQNQFHLLDQHLEPFSGQSQCLFDSYYPQTSEVQATDPVTLLEGLHDSNSNPSNPVFPSLSEEKEYTRRMKINKSPGLPKAKETPLSYKAMDDCLFKSPEIGLGILLEPVQEESTRKNIDCEFQFRLTSLTKTYKPDFVAVLELMIQEHKVNTTRVQLGFSNCASALNNKLWLFWNGDRFKLLFFQEFGQMYTCHFWDNNLSTKCSITSIYGKHTGSQRKELWKDISDNVISDHLWILGGDFNVICSLEEHQGLTTPTLADITDFKDCIEAIPLICPAFEGGLKATLKNWSRETFGDIFEAVNEVEFKAVKAQEYLITLEDNFMMGRIPNEAEIQKEVWDLSPTSSAGPDGFNGSFFRVCWSIIKEDVIKVTQEVFLEVPIPMAFGSTLITLIPKKKVCKHFSDYRSISLSTLMSKINSRILASRLQTLLSKIISKEQAGFQKGMGVDDHILMTCEMVHSLDKHCDSGNAIIKLDMAKAFDKIE
ncbi:unnamed protein product [Cuscuta campestris]|uniref:Reverse transcriptase domain-containing protein n=1 Tax=Cuscuta campestris TaxID=132261 RepID=A0A484N6Q2_9ASTE|nr:unnamed protein product [Cuscuta campestris]